MLLEAAGVAFEIVSSAVDEEEIKRSLRGAGADAASAADALALAKARRVSQRYPGALVVGADQILECGGQWFDKPADMDHARAHLVALRGRTHVLATGVCVVRDGERLWHERARPALTMREFSDRFLDHYLALEGTAVLSSVGAYRLEGPGAQLFAAIAGDHFSILGLPLLPLLDFLRQHGVLER
ncbi:nucleoside triphosphate pyrophosphatase [Stella sp.]|uniref:Maf family protein n=1 Tax=Stella sp. TaxID=2912054 RepID=UPI0035B156BA